MSRRSSFSTDTRLQIGLEIEFVSPRNKKWEDDNLAEAPRAVQERLVKDACYHHLAESLFNNDLLSAYSMTLPANEYPENPLRALAPRGSMPLNNTRIFGNPDNFVDKTSRNSIFRYWLTKFEQHLSQDERYSQWITTELNSPILREEAVYSTGFSDLDTALTTIHSAYDEAPHITDSCGLHVHLGVETDMTLPYAKRVVSLAFVLDRPLLFPLCSPGRKRVHRPIVRNSDLGSSNDTFSEEYELMDEILDHLPKSLLDAETRVLARMWAAESFHALQLLTEYDSKRYGGFPGTAFKSYSSGSGLHNVYTIEFRHAQASFRRSFVQNWSRIVLAIGRVALLPADRFKAAMDRIWMIYEESHTSEIESDEGQICIPTLKALSDAAIEAGAPGPLDVSFWQNRLNEMNAGQNLEVYGDLKACLD